MAQNASRPQERWSRLPQWNRECFAAPRARVDSKESKSRLLQWNRKQFLIRRARVDSQTAGVDSHRKIQRTASKVPDGESTPELRESTPELLKTLQRLVFAAFNALTAIILCAAINGAEFKNLKNFQSQNLRDQRDFQLRIKESLKDHSTFIYSLIVCYQKK